MTEEHGWLDEELGALAREERRMAVPPAIRSAVMAAWDHKAASPRRLRSRAALWVPVASAAGLVLVLTLTRGNVDEKAIPAHEPLISEAVPSAPPAAAESPITGPEPVDNVRPRVTQLPLPPLDGEFVLVPDPFADQTTMNVVRVRMSRMAFASLGVPIGNPEADGLVEVEMVVGDDGIARTIRRAAFVSDSIEGGVPR